MEKNLSFNLAGIAQYNIIGAADGLFLYRFVTGGAGVI